MQQTRDVERVHATLSEVFEQVAVAPDSMYQRMVSLPPSDLAQFRFSDLFVRALYLSKGIKRHRLSKFLVPELVVLGLAQAHLLDETGTLVRGAITTGDLYADDTSNIIFGPALIRAHQLESTVAVFPRVVLDPQIVTECGGPQFFHAPYIDSTAWRGERPEFGDVVVYKLLRQDSDGMFYIDYLMAALMFEHLGDDDSWLALLERHKSFILTALRDASVYSGRPGNEAIFQKIAWLRS